MGRYLFRLAFLMSIGAVAAAQQPPGGSSEGQRPAVIFRANTNLIEVNALVTDDRGNFVKDLKKDDFEIYEDGRPHAPTFFSLVDLPVERPFTPAYATQPIESDVRSATRNFEGRLYVLALDDLHTGVFRSPQVREAARRFIEQYFSAGDLGAVVTTSGQTDGAQELTSSRALLLAAIDKFQGRKLPSASGERLAVHLRDVYAVASEEAPTRNNEDLDRVAATADPLDSERGYNARRALGVVEDVAKWMGDIQGVRKSVLLFSEGIDYDIYEPFNRGSASAIVEYARAAVAAAQRANVTVYAVDPRGLGDGEAVFAAGYSLYPQLEFTSVRGAWRELLLSQESLISLADETGGLAVIRTNDLASGLGRIVRDASAYYSLGYYSDSTRTPGRLRKIEVKVKRPGLRVRARKGYLPVDPKAVAKAQQVEAKAGTSPALKAALSSPLPGGELPLRVFAASFKDVGKNASVLVTTEIDGRSLKFTPREGRFHTTIEISIVAVDHQLKVQGTDRQTFNLKLLPQTHERVSQSGLRFLSRLNLPPARYQIRVGAHDQTSGAVGMLRYDLETPEYMKAPFVLSSIGVTSSRAESVVTPRPDPEWTRVFPTPPIATRTFARRETLGVFTELYDNSDAVSHGVDLAATVRAARDGRTVFSTRDERTIEGSAKPRTHGYKVEIPLTDLGPGMYVLRVEATSRASKQTTYREVPFEVTGEA